MEITYSSPIEVLDISGSHFDNVSYAMVDRLWRVGSSNSSYKYIIIDNDFKLQGMVAFCPNNFTFQIISASYNEYKVKVVRLNNTGSDKWEKDLAHPKAFDKISKKEVMDRTFNCLDPYEPEVNNEEILEWKGKFDNLYTNYAKLKGEHENLWEKYRELKEEKHDANDYIKLKERHHLLHEAYLKLKDRYQPDFHLISDIKST